MLVIMVPNSVCAAKFDSLSDLAIHNRLCQSIYFDKEYCDIVPDILHKTVDLKL